MLHHGSLSETGICGLGEAHEGTSFQLLSEEQKKISIYWKNIFRIHPISHSPPQNSKISTNFHIIAPKARAVRRRHGVGGGAPVNFGRRRRPVQNNRKRRRGAGENIDRKRG